MIVIGIKCKTETCPNVIALQEVKEVPTQAAHNPDIEHPFIAKCEICGEAHSYTNDDLGSFEC